MPSFCPPLRTLIQTFFSDYLQLVEPDTAEHLRLDEANFLTPQTEAEFSGWSEEDRSGLGVVAEVPGRRGEKVTLLVQVEPEAPSPDEVSDRLGRYFMDLEIRYCQPVLLSVVCLHGGRPGVNLETAVANRVFGIEVLRIFYTLFSLAGSRAEYYLDRPEPLAWALSTLMRPARLSRAELRRACLQRIAAAPLGETQRSLLTTSVEVFLEDSAVRAPVLGPPPGVGR